MSLTKGQQITTITFFRFSGFKNKIWGFGMMQFAHKDLSTVKGQCFYKLMGSGKGIGFNPLPDWSVYSLLQIWENEKAAKDFFEHSDLIGRYREHTSELWTLYLKNITAKGEWSGKNPFEKSGSINPDSERIAIITRATIRIRKLWHFWRYVPASQSTLSNNQGLIFTKGIGEVPIVQMATFSLWDSYDSVKAFAYQSKGHQEAIKKTRELNWYKEELFSRFQPYHSEGTWEGRTLFEAAGRPGNHRHDAQ